MDRIVLPDNTTDGKLSQNLGKEKCPKCGSEIEVNRPIKKMQELKENVGIHNFTLKGEIGHTTHLYWEYDRHDELPIRVFATPNCKDALGMDEDINEEDNFVAFAVGVKDNQLITGNNVKVEGELTVEKYLKVVRDFIEKHLVWAYNEKGNIVEGEKEYK